MVYTRGIRGVFMGYTYVSGMCRECIGNVSGICRRQRGAWEKVCQPPTSTDGHGNTIYIFLVQCRSVQFSGQSITAERCLSVGDIPTTDEHGTARKHGDIINDNIDNLRPNQYPLGAKRGNIINHG